MKKNLIAILLFLFIGTSAFGQITAFKGWTIKAGTNYSTMVSKYDKEIPYKYKFGFTGGFALDWSFTDIMGLSIEALYSQQGGELDLKSKKKGVSITENSSYLNIPILANVYLTETLTLKTGIQLGYFINANDKIKGITEDERQYDLISAYNMIDFTIPVGLCYEFKNRLVIDARYHFGLTDVLKETGPKFKNLKSYNSYASLTVGIRF